MYVLKHRRRPYIYERHRGLRELTSYHKAACQGWGVPGLSRASCGQVRVLWTQGQDPRSLTGDPHGWPPATCVLLGRSLLTICWLSTNKHGGQCTPAMDVHMCTHCSQMLKITTRGKRKGKIGWNLWCDISERIANEWRYWQTRVIKINNIY